ncbi:hypothetical protein MJ561_17975 [Klebsiella pneumoniae]|nr:hypothetical protein MJ561_17975 [Klebsiella pneumoniae]
MPVSMGRGQHARALLSEEVRRRAAEGARKNARHDQASDYDPSKEKAWFSLPGRYQPKINKLIFLVIFLVQSASTMIA